MQFSLAPEDSTELEPEELVAPAPAPAAPPDLNVTTSDLRLSGDPAETAEPIPPEVIALADDDEDVEVPPPAPEAVPGLEEHPEEHPVQPPAPAVSFPAPAEPVEAEKRIESASEPVPAPSAPVAERPQAPEAETPLPDNVIPFPQPGEGDSSAKRSILRKTAAATTTAESGEVIPAESGPARVMVNGKWIIDRRTSSADAPRRNTTTIKKRPSAKLPKDMAEAIKDLLQEHGAAGSSEGSLGEDARKEFADIQRRLAAVESGAPLAPGDGASRAPDVASLEEFVNLRSSVEAMKAEQEAMRSEFSARILAAQQKLETLEKATMGNAKVLRSRAEQDAAIAEQLTSLADRLTAILDQFDRATARITALEERPAGDPTLATRVQAIESATGGEISEELRGAIDRVAQLDAQVASFQSVLGRLQSMLSDERIRTVAADATRETLIQAEGALRVLIQQEMQSAREIISGLTLDVLNSPEGSVRVRTMMESLLHELELTLTLVGGNPSLNIASPAPSAPSNVIPFPQQVPAPAAPAVDTRPLAPVIPFPQPAAAAMPAAPAPTPAPQVQWPPPTTATAAPVDPFESFLQAAQHPTLGAVLPPSPAPAAEPSPFANMQITPSRPAEDLPKAA